MADPSPIGSAACAPRLPIPIAAGVRSRGFKPLPDRAAVAALLSYDAETGAFIRKAKADDAPGAAQFNAKYAGKPAGEITHRGYVRIYIGRVEYYAHRLAWLLVYGDDPSLEIDHIDCNKQNNAISNLRLATAAQNSANRLRLKKKTTPKGVGQKGSAFTAVVEARGQRHYLGTFKTEEAAATAYVAAATELFGSFARGG